MDAVGKKTQAALLAARIRADVFSFPDYDTEAGQLVRSHLFRKWKCVVNVDRPHENDERLASAEKELDAMVFQALHTASRLERRGAILDSLKRRSVVFDRYWLSGLIYGSLDGLKEPWLRAINEDVMPKPDIWILIDIPLEEALRRSIERSPTNRDRYETNAEFMGKVKQQYIDVFRSMDAENNLCPQCQNMVEPCATCNSTGTWPIWRVVDGMGTKEEVHERIVSTIKERHAYYFSKDPTTSPR